MAGAMVGAEAARGSRSLASSEMARPAAIDDELLENVDAGSSYM